MLTAPRSLCRLHPRQARGERSPGRPPALEGFLLGYSPLLQTSNSSAPRATPRPAGPPVKGEPHTASWPSWDTLHNPTTTGAERKGAGGHRECCSLQEEGRVGCGRALVSGHIRGSAGRCTPPASGTGPSWAWRQLQREGHLSISDGRELGREDEPKPGGKLFQALGSPEPPGPGDYEEPAAPASQRPRRSRLGPHKSTGGTDQRLQDREPLLQML